MFGLGTEVILAIGGNIVGVVSGLLANAQKAKADQHKMMMERLTFDMERMKAQSEMSNKEFELRSKDRFSSMTRRVLVLFLMIMVAVISLAPMLGTVDIAVPVEMKSGGKYLLGLIDTSKTWIEWHTIKNAVMFRENFDTILVMIFSFYVGSSAVKR
jgi:hypothetical protein